MCVGQGSCTFECPAGCTVHLDLDVSLDGTVAGGTRVCWMLRMSKK